MKSKVTLLKRLLLGAAATVFVFTCLLVSAGAQELRGKISGRVVDPNGAAIPGASVKVIDVAKNNTASFTTNNDGLFTAPYLLPGTYQVLVEVAGFKKSIQDKVVVAINETRDLEIKLDLGTPQETVTVTSEPGKLTETDGNLGQTVDRKRVDELPSVHGDPYHLINLTPGVAYTGSTRLDRPFEPTHIANFAMSGARGIRSDLLIDGAPSTATANANEVIASYVPTTDATQEFKVQTATYDAQFGNTEGGVTSIVTKSGTNDYHGTGYYWIEPGGWAANDFFGNSRGQGRPFTYSNRPGFSVGGPIWIPKVYNGKNKSFFFFSFEQIADSRPRFDATNIWAPTSAMKNGDFSAFANSVTIFDPLTGTFANGATTNRTPFANNIIPAARINPVARAVVAFMGSPKHGPNQNALINGNNTDSTLAEVLNPPYRNYTMRFDQNIGDKDKVFGRYSWYNRVSSYNNYTDSIYVGDRFLFISKQGMIDEVHTFNANTVLNLRYGFNRFIRGSDAPEGQYGLDLTTLGFPAAYNNAIGEGIRRFPRFDFNCTSCTGAAVGNGHTNEFRPVSSHFLTAVLNRTQGIHSFKFGGEMRIYREDDSFRSNAQSGQFIFDNSFTRVGSVSSPDVEGIQGFAAFLLGYPTTMQIVRQADYSEYSKTWGFFAQDDIRLTQKLTLNLGLRYEVEQPLAERQFKTVAGFDFGYIQPFEGQAQANFAANIPATDLLKTTYGVTQITARGGLLFANPSTDLYTTPKNGILPRVGVAYSFNDKTVFRGGIGLYQGFLGERRGDVIQPGYTLTTVQTLTTGPNGAPLPFLLSNPFPSGINEPSGSSAGRQTSLGQGITFFNQNPKVAKQVRYSIGVQRELWGGWVLEANYVGDYGSDIEINRNLNATPNRVLNTDGSRTAAMTTNNTNLSATVRNPFCNTLNGTACANGAGLFTGVAGQVARRSLLVAYPEFGAVTTTNNDGKSWYHSGQFSLNKRFSKGYGLQASYTWSKWLQQTEYLNAGDERPTKVVSDQDVPHRFSMSGFYELPFGKGQRFGSDASRWVDVIIGGWQIEGTFVYQSGFPLTFGSDAFYRGGDISIPKSQQTVARWFNTGAFQSFFDWPSFLPAGVTESTASAAQRTAAQSAATTAATPVDHLRTLPLRFTNVRLHPTNNVDLGLRKDIRIDETKKIQLRMEFINAFNHPLLASLSGGAPVVTPTTSTFGSITASNQQNYARRAQLMVKFLF